MVIYLFIRYIARGSCIETWFRVPIEIFRLGGRGQSVHGTRLDFGQMPDIPYPQMLIVARCDDQMWHHS